MKVQICKVCKATFVPENFIESKTCKCKICLNQTRCKGITIHGRRCSHNSTIDGYCMGHYNKLKKEILIQKIERRAK